MAMSMKRRMLLSDPVGKSCEFTMEMVGRIDPRRVIPDGYTVPSPETRLLRARLILEEALETIHALGCVVQSVEDTTDPAYEVGFKIAPDVSDAAIDLEAVIDGCCDTAYVAIGTLLACGAPDMPHLQAVCEANDNKFPDGVPVLHPTTGKFLKPEGWTPPDHKNVMELVKEMTS